MTEERDIPSCYYCENDIEDENDIFDWMDGAKFHKTCWELYLDKK